MDRFEKRYRNLEEIKGKINNITRYSDGTVGIQFEHDNKLRAKSGEFMLSPDDLKKINFKGDLEPGMDIIVRIDETESIENLERILH